MTGRTFVTLLLSLAPLAASPLTIDGHPVTLTLHPAGEHGLRVTLNPGDTLPLNPAIVERKEEPPVLDINELTSPTTVPVNQLKATLTPDPLTLHITRADGSTLQKLVFEEKGIRFLLDDHPVLGLGEGGPLPQGDWRKAGVEFDRRGRFFKMEPRWQSDAYGSRNPVPLLIGTSGWTLYFTAPWGQIDLRGNDHGTFLPLAKDAYPAERQTHGNQQQQLGKGRPPMEHYVEGLRDLFIFNVAGDSSPHAFMKDLATISGQAVMPPKWALGYMQSHRTLVDDEQMVGIVDTFRDKRIPLDAVIYLGTGFCPAGWNKQQPSFEFNPAVFKRDPTDVISDLHERHVKVGLHIVPWDRDRLPHLTESAFEDYWKNHLDLVQTGIDAWWPDEGDWFDLHERLARHQFYYEQPQVTQPDRRPWSLHRNGHLGIARWGGWVWSGDTQSTWKSLEAQIAVGINHSLSVGPYWGSDIGGFFSTPELDGELYARWFQFGAFCPSFRSHGRTWWMRLPWGWGLDEMGPIEDSHPPLASALDNQAIEPITRKYAELRYQLLTYNYTLAHEARTTGLPFMRALWLHYPDQPELHAIADQYLWGRDLLVAPVYEKGATTRTIVLPPGDWYGYWTNGKHSGNQTLTRPIDLATMPIYVRAGTILPLDPLRQYTSEKSDQPLTLRIYRGADGSTELYHDAGDGADYLTGESSLTRLSWNEKNSTLTISPAVNAQHKHTNPQTFRVELIPGGGSRAIDWDGSESKFKW